MSNIETITVGGTQYNIGGGGGLLPHIVITSESENTITVTTPSGSIITPTSTSSGVWECDVDEYGIYTVDATYDGHDAEETVTVDMVKVYAVEIHIVTIPDGSTVLPTDDIQTWLECAGITDKAYTILAEVLADTDTYTTLLGDSNACDYMARSTTWASTIVADADAMRLLGMYDYACDALLSDSTWASAIVGSSYWSSVYDITIPKMTSNTAPSGTASASMSSSSYPAWKAFDQTGTSSWAYLLDGTNGECYLRYQFPSAVCINGASFAPRVTTYTTHEVTYKVQASNDGTTWTDLYTKSSYTATENGTEISCFDNTNAYTYYQIWFSGGLANSSSTYFTYLYTLQFYGRHTAQTDIIVSAPSDTIYYMDNGSPVTLCTTDTSGIGSVDWSDLPTGDITLYSSVAKNPTDLTADYSKTIKVTKNKVEGYLMPDNSLYWYGFEDARFKTIVATSYRASGSGGTAKTPTITRNTNDIRVVSNSASNAQGSAIINNVPLDNADTVSVIGVSNTVDTYVQWWLNVATNANISADQYTYISRTNITATMAKGDIDVSSVTGSHALTVMLTMVTATIHALWLE